MPITEVIGHEQLLTALQAFAVEDNHGELLNAITARVCAEVRIRTFVCTCVFNHAFVNLPELNRVNVRVGVARDGADEVEDGVFGEGRVGKEHINLLVGNPPM